MKKMFKTVIVMMLAVLLLVGVAVPAVSAQVEEDKALAVGRTDAPTWGKAVATGGLTWYSTNESVVVASGDGTVTAVGEGTADVVSTGFVIHYTVASKEAIINYVQKVREKTLQLGETDAPSEAVFVTGGNETWYSTNESVIVVSGDGTVTAVGEGTANVIVGEDHLAIRYTVIPKSAAVGNGSFDNNNPLGSILGENSEFVDRFNKIQDHNDTMYSVMSVVALVFFGILPLCFLLFLLIWNLCFTHTTMGPKALPVATETHRTIKTATAERMVFEMPINKKMNVKKFEDEVNAWLAENPYIYDCKFRLETRQALFVPFAPRKFSVKKAVIEYSVSDTKQNQQYGFAFLYKFRFFGLTGYTPEKQVAQWNVNNPAYLPVYARGGKIQHFGTLGFFAHNYNYVFFKKK